MKHRLALITGSTGFIGSRLVATLVQRDWNARVTVRASSQRQRLADINCEEALLDLAQPTEQSLSQALEGVTHVFHVAGRVAGTPAQLDLVNRLGTDSLIRAAARISPPPIFVLVSSAAAGGPADSSQPRRPDMSPQPVSNYGKSKLDGERVAIDQHANCPLTIVRPGIVFGQGDTEFIRIFRAMTRTHINPLVGRGHQPLSMIDVDDLVDLLIRAAESGRRVIGKTPHGDASDGVGVYNAADPLPLSLRQLGQLVRDALPGLRILDLPLHPRIGFGVGALAEWGARLVGKSSTLSRDKIREAKTQGWVLDVEKSMRELQWQPRQPLAKQLVETLLQARSAGVV